MPRFDRHFVKCDRCGQIFEEISGKTPSVMWMKFQSFNTSSDRHDYANGNQTYYFCSDCEKSFADWFAAEKDDCNSEETIESMIPISWLETYTRLKCVDHVHQIMLEIIKIWKDSVTVGRDD